MLTIQRPATTSLLASFATLKGLSDEKKYQSPYQILQEFIRYIILTDSVYSFSAVEMKNLLNKHFGFQIPEAVIKTASKNMDSIDLNNGTYNVSMADIGEDTLFQEKKKEADEYSLHIIRDLSNYISGRMPDAFIDEDCLLKDLICFLIDDPLNSTKQYTELIGEFVLKNEHDEKIQSGLNRIREGSILYIGLSHNINETGSISKPLKLYLGTEILFSLVGYNGTVYQQLANDFYNQVRLANSGTKKKISLYYFGEIKKEIEEFFATAEAIVDGKEHQWLDKPAMKAITDGCNTSADVTVKQSDFFTKLKTSFGIIEDKHESYYDEKYFTSNLESTEYEEDDDEERKRKKETGLRLISHINKLREGKHFSFDLESEHLIVTNTKATLLVSKEQTDAIKNEEGLDYICNFAVTLDKITSMLWYKLGSGFATGKYPISINALLQARVVLSSNVGKKANRAFEEIKEQYNSGVVSEEQVAARIITLRNKPKLPEDLQGDDIEETMDFSPEYLSRFEEQYKNAQDSLKEKDELIETIKSVSNKTITEKDATIASQKATIRKKEDENTKLQDEINEYRRRDEALIRKKAKRKNLVRFIWSILWKLLILAAFSILTFVLENKFNCKIPTYISRTVEVMGFVITFWIALKKDKEKYFGNCKKNKQ